MRSHSLPPYFRFSAQNVLELTGGVGGAAKLIVLSGRRKRWSSGRGKASVDCTEVSSLIVSNGAGSGAENV